MESWISLAECVDAINNENTPISTYSHSTSIKPINTQQNKSSNESYASIGNSNSEWEVPLPDGFSFDCLRPSENELQELSAFLEKNQQMSDKQRVYVIYPVSYLKWLLSDPRQPQELLLKVIATRSRAIVGFVAGVVQDYNIGKVVQACLLTVHKRYRGKRLTSVLSQQFVHQMRKAGITQGVATASSELRDPFREFRQYIYLNKLLLNKKQSSSVIRVGGESDLPYICGVFREQQKDIGIAQIYSDEQVKRRWLAYPDQAMVLLWQKRKKEEVSGLAALHFQYEINNGALLRVAVIDCLHADQQDWDRFIREVSDYISAEHRIQVLVGRESLYSGGLWNERGFTDSESNLRLYLYNIKATADTTVRLVLE